jgi:hypothetical protein
MRDQINVGVDRSFCIFIDTRVVAKTTMFPGTEGLTL